MFLGAISTTSNKPSAAPTMVTTASRSPLANHLAGHTGGKPRFVRPQTGPSTAASSGLLVHSQLVVSSGNHGTTVRPALVTNTGAKVSIYQLISIMHVIIIIAMLFFIIFFKGDKSAISGFYSFGSSTPSRKDSDFVSFPCLNSTHPCYLQK